jgi:hypothetical protein
MRYALFALALLAWVALPSPSAAQGAAGAALRPLVGTWELASLQRGASLGQTLSDVANPVGLLIQDAGGYVMEIVTLAGRPANMRPADQFTTYQAFWGKFSVNPATSTATYSISGDMDPRRTGQQLVRTYERKGNQLVLTETRDGAVTRTTWDRMPELEALPDYQLEAIGFWQWVAAGLYDAKDQNVRPAFRDESAILYTPTGHMAVLYLPPPGRKKFAGPAPTDEEARAAMMGSVSYFGTYVVQPKSRAVYHYQLAAAVPANVGGSFQRNFEIKGPQLFLRFPVQMLNGQPVQNRLTLKRLSGLKEMWPEFTR